MSLKIRMISVLGLTNRRLVVSTILAMAALLLTTSATQAQGYFLGYYYPDEKRFHSDHNSTEVVADSYVVPYYLRMYDTSQTVPVMNVSRPVVAAAARSGSLHLIVPNAQAKVWFENTGTKSTGRIRDFVTPPIAAGAKFKYHIKVTWNESGQDLTIERDVTVTPGQSAAVDFTEAAQNLRMSRGIATSQRR